MTCFQGLIGTQVTVAMNKVGVVPHVFELANSIAPLAAGATFTGPTVRMNDFNLGSSGANVVDALLLLSGGGTAFFEVSKDGVTWELKEAVTLDPNVPHHVQGLRLTGIFSRLRVTDGGAGSPTVVIHADLRGI